MVDIKKMALNMELMNKKLEYLIRQIERGKIKSPSNITYDQLNEQVAIAVENNQIKKVKIAKIL